MVEAFQITESDFVGLKNDVRDLKDLYPSLINKHHETTTTLTTAFSRALDQSANSLSIPLLRDVLVPIIMKLFLFFAALIMGILGTVIGIKWLAGDVLKSLQ